MLERGEQNRKEQNRAEQYRTGGKVKQANIRNVQGGDIVHHCNKTEQNRTGQEMQQENLRNVYREAIVHQCNSLCTQLRHQVDAYCVEFSVLQGADALPSEKLSPCVMSTTRFLLLCREVHCLDKIHVCRAPDAACCSLMPRRCYT